MNGLNLVLSNMPIHYTTPQFSVCPKKGQGLRVMQDFRELNNHSHIDKYSMKEITECIIDIRCANSTILQHSI